MQTLIYGPSLQAVGAFDGGKIKEQKPIGFPGEGSVVKRVGPLFYWAWATSEQEGYIPLHPHQAFEIMTYVIQGEAHHGDTLGTRSTIGAGGAQVMQTGSGVSHEERFGSNAEAFQIWFEPYIQEALRTTPTYNQYEHEQFPSSAQEGVVVKTVLGENSPIQLTVDAFMWDIAIEPGKTYRHPVQEGRTLTALAIRGGGGRWANGSNDAAASVFKHRDFIVVRTDEAFDAVIQADETTPVRIVLIDVPTKVDYPLYPKR